MGDVADFFESQNINSQQDFNNWLDQNTQEYEIQILLDIRKLKKWMNLSDTEIAFKLIVDAEEYNLLNSRFKEIIEYLKNRKEQIGFLPSYLDCILNRLT